MANKADPLHSVQNELVPLTAPELDTYRVTGYDFPNKGGSGMGDKPGHDDLMPETDLQTYPRYNADDGSGESGAGTPSVWGKEGKGFMSSVNKGEGDEPSKAMMIAEGVDLIGGQITCKGYKQTPKGEVEEASVSIGRH
jgi:hypothetical protein